MLENILEVNQALFYLINSVWSTPFFDWLMPWLRNKYLWTPVYLFLIVFFTVNYRFKGFQILIFLALVVLFCDQLSSSFIKPYFKITRPCNDPYIKDYINLLVPCGSGYSFVSSHAANHFGVSTFLGLLFWRKTRIILPLAFLWATMIAYAQVYVGVHYPVDVAGGALLGIFIGATFSLICQRQLKLFGN